MNKIQCIAVDDEPLALDVIENFSARLPHLELRSFNSPVQALDYLREHPVDLVFLDINMPEMMGMELAAAMEQLPPIIFTTAYAEYALDSFEFNTVDYLLKPYNFERFAKAVDKVMKLIAPSPAEKSITFKVDYRSVKLPIEKILYIEAMGNYLKIFTKTQTYLPQMTMKEAEALLGDLPFKRIHRSYIVNMDAVQSFNRREVTVAGQVLPLGKSYLDSFTSS